MFDLIRGKSDKNGAKRPFLPSIIRKRLTQNHVKRWGSVE